MDKVSLIQMAESSLINVEFDFEKDGAELQRLSDIILRRCQYYVNRAAAFCLYDIVCKSGGVQIGHDQRLPACCDPEVVEAIEKLFRTLTQEEQTFLQAGMIFQNKEMAYLDWLIQHLKQARAEQASPQQAESPDQATDTITVTYSKTRNKLGVEFVHVGHWDLLAQAIKKSTGLSFQWAHAASLFMTGLQHGLIEGHNGKWTGCVYSPHVVNALVGHLLTWKGLDLYSFMESECVLEMLRQYQEKTEAVERKSSKHRRDRERRKAIRRQRASSRRANARK